MYCDNYFDQIVILFRDEKPTARKNHECCECGIVILKGEKYWYVFGVWQDYGSSSQPNSYKTCLECERDWIEILRVFHENREARAHIVFEMLSEAIQDAHDAGFLQKDDRLVREWLVTEDEKAVMQMRVHSTPLL
ncbi:MAG: hypothetical protein ABH805_00690 [Candidatus Nealsonbacteria bacterium]